MRSRVRVATTDQAAPIKNRAPLGARSVAKTAIVRYFACAFSAAMSASLRSVITPILLSR
jgi:hypothetical protein